MSQAYKAPNGEILIAQDDVQEAAFKNAGMEPTEGQPAKRGRPKSGD